MVVRALAPTPAERAITEAMVERLGLRVRLAEGDDAVLAAIRQAHAQAAQAGTPLAWDLETAPRDEYRDHPRAGLDPHLSWPRLLSFHARGQSDAWVCDLWRCKGPDLVLKEVVETGPSMAHNAAFDLAFAMLWGAEPDMDQVHCTQHLSRAVFGSGHLGLARTVVRCFGPDFNTEKAGQLGNYAQPHVDQWFSYAALDAALVSSVWAHMQSLLGEGDVRAEMYRRLRRTLISSARTSLCGLRIDRNGLETYIDECEEAKADAHVRSARLLGIDTAEKITPNVKRDWIVSMFGEDTLGAWPRTDTGLLSVSTKTLKAFNLANDFHAQALADLSWYEKHVQLAEDILSKISPATGRLHPNYRIGSTDTLRSSSSDPNVMAVPSRGDGIKLRRFFKAPDGRVLVGGDCGQEEPRVLSFVSGEPELQRVFTEGRDIYKAIMSMLFDIPEADVTKADRSVAKVLFLALSYGLGAGAMSEDLWVVHQTRKTVDECQALKVGFFERFSRAAQWRDAMITYAEQTMTVPFCGGIRDLRNEPPKEDWRVRNIASNAPIQGASAVIMLEALARFEQAVGSAAPVCLHVHDEATVAALPEDAEAVGHELSRAFQDAFVDVLGPGSEPLSGPRFFTSEQVDSWADLKD